MDIDKLLNFYGAKVVQDLKDEMSRKGLNASGQTSNSIRYEITSEGLKVYAKRSILTLVYGRGASKGQGNGALLENIKEWVKYKGIDTRFAYAIARKIHKEGIKVPNQYNDGKLFEQVFNKVLLENIKKDFKAAIYGTINIKNA